MFEKFKETLTNASGGALESQLGNIQDLVKQQIGPMAAEIAQDDEKMTMVMKKVYTVLPMPVRLAVKEDKFVEFCFAHKDKVLSKISN